MSEDGVQVLHWVPEHDRWEPIGWDRWQVFRDGTASLPGVAGGIHYFIVCLHDDGRPVDLVPHKYLIKPDGKIGRDNFAGLTCCSRPTIGAAIAARS